MLISDISTNRSAISDLQQHNNLSNHLATVNNILYRSVHCWPCPVLSANEVNERSRVHAQARKRLERGLGKARTRAMKRLGKARTRARTRAR